MYKTPNYGDVLYPNDVRCPEPCDIFVSPATKDFRLKVATPVGLNMPAEFSKDMNGNVRGADGVVDRGAFEFGSGNTPLISAPKGLEVK